MTKCCIEISSIFDSSIILMLHVLSANVMCRRPLQAGSFVNGTQDDAKVDCLIWHRDVVLQSSYVCFYLHNLYIYHFRKCADKNFIYFLYHLQIYVYFFTNQSLGKKCIESTIILTIEKISQEITQYFKSPNHAVEPPL